MPQTKLLIALLAAMIGFTMAILLGNWQTRRAEARLASQQQFEAAEMAPSVDIAPTRAALDAVAAALPRKVRVTGTFDATGSVYLDNRTLDGVAGFYVITPLVIATGVPAVLVDRGWTSRDMRDRTRIDAEPPPAGEVELTGLAVARPAALWDFGQAPDKVPGIWQNLDYETYERITGREVARFVVRQARETSAGRPADGLRREWPAAASGADKNRGYALQWYSLAALIAGLGLYFGWQGWRKR